MTTILLIEDDRTFALMLSKWLGKQGFEVSTQSTISGALKTLQESSFDLILSDLRLPDGEGDQIAHWCKKENIPTPIIILTAYGEIQSAVAALKAGVADYIEKPINPSLFLEKINEVLQPTPAKDEPIQESKQEDRLIDQTTPPPSHLEGDDPLSTQLYQHLNLVATTDMSVLIQGESGTGKEYVARQLHERSHRKEAPFIAIDCGAIPHELAASEFFGHVKGSFTGAIDNKVGAFVAAQGGTLFLDEVGNLPYALQVQLLRAIQERLVRPVGSTKEQTIDVRIVAATNENLLAAIEKGDFREDLYHRLNEFSLHVPPLRERKKDILTFAQLFLAQANQQLNKKISAFSTETIALFLKHPWCGNLREMRNVVRYATLMATDKIQPEHLPAEFHSAQEEKQNKELSTLLLKDKMSEAEKIEEAIKYCDGNKAAAARLLGVDRKTLYNRLKKLNLDL